MKILQTDFIEALARFWDIHDLIDVEDELEDIREPVFERTPTTAVAIHLQPEEVESVKRIAPSRGVEDAALLREWVLEKLHQS